MEAPSSPSSRSPFNRFFSFLDNRAPSDRWFFTIALLIFVVSLFYTAFTFSIQSSTTLPGIGGTLKEGMIGTPRFINPVLAITRVDQDLSALVYNGLMKLDVDGTLIPELAESVTTSEDGLVYAITLKNDLKFSDGTPLTTEDIAFTVALIQDPELKSPLRGNWNDVTVEVISETELNLVVAEAYVPFRNNLTVGILPKHIWGSLTVDELPFSQYNTHPIGSGLFAVTEVERDATGLITGYTLEENEHSSEMSNIQNISLLFYQSESEVITALETGDIMSTAALSNAQVAAIRDDYSILENPLPRVFGVFMNQNRSTVLRDQAVRKALEIAIDREVLIDDVLFGFGEPTDLPVPTGFHSLESSTTVATTSSSTIESARAVLEAGGWEPNGTGGWQKEIDEETVTLAFTITTANNALFEATAVSLEETWRAIGADVSMALFERADLVQAIIRPRNYEMLLFGTDVNRSLDLYPFWHSSQREDPGLNVSLYTNIAADDYLEDHRVSQSDEERAALLQSFITEIQSDQPAIFLFNPTFTYVTDPLTIVTPVTLMNRPSERFSTISSWHLHVEKLWPTLIK